MKLQDTVELMNSTDFKERRNRGHKVSEKMSAASALLM